MVNTHTKTMHHFTRESSFDKTISVYSWTSSNMHGIYSQKWKRGEERLSINRYYASPLKWCGGDCRDFEVDFTPSGVWIVSFPHQVNQKQRKSESKAFCFLWNIIDLLGLGSVSSSFLYIDVLFLPFFANWRLLLQQLNYVMRICEHNFCILVYVYY